MPKYIVSGDVINAAFCTEVEANNEEEALEMCSNKAPAQLPGEWSVASEHEFTMATNAVELDDE